MIGFTAETRPTGARRRSAGFDGARRGRRLVAVKPVDLDELKTFLSMMKD